MTDTPAGLSHSVEDYLKVIYALNESGEAAGTSELARALDVQPASVSGMVRRLASEGLLEHVPYRGVRLTAAGVCEALRVVRRHRIIETFLARHLGFSGDDVHEEAERLEHAASDRLVDRMANALGNPATDPHGAPIPTRSAIDGLQQVAAAAPTGRSPASAHPRAPRTTSSGRAGCA